MPRLSRAFEAGRPAARARFLSRPLCRLSLILATLPAWAGEAATRALPAPALPWLNEPALAERLDPGLAGQLAQIYRELAQGPRTAQSGPLFSALAGLQCADAGGEAAQRRLLDVKGETLERDRGVNFEAGARYDPDTGDVDSGGHSAYAGLSWEVYRDGMWDARLESRRYRLQRALLDARQARAEAGANLGCRHSRLIAGFNTLKLGLLGERERLLGALLGVYRQAYFLGFVNLDEVIGLERDLERTRHFMAGYREFNRGLGDAADALAAAFQDEPPLLDVRIDALLAAIRTDPVYPAVASLEREIVEQRLDPRRDKRLRFYVHPRLKWDTDFNTGADLVAGVSFSMPLAEGRDVVRDAERVLPALRQAEAQAGDADETLRLYHEYKYRLDDAIKLHYQRALILERLRRAFAENDLPPAQRGGLAEMLQGVRDLLDTQLEMLDVKQNLHVRLLQLFARSGQGYRPEFVAEVGQTPLVTRGREGERALYVWSDAFNRFSNPVLLHLLKTKAFSGVVVSAGHKTRRDKLDEFLRLAGEAGVRVELMASDNDWARPEQADKAFAQAQALWARAPHLHLDVEPHALADFKERRAAYLGAFERLLRRLAQARQPGQTLSVALPTLLDEAEAKALAAHADRVYVMAYGSDKPETVLRRLQRFRTVPAERLVLALRPTDFAGELELEAFIQAVVRESPIRRFAVHDLAQFQTMIERSQ